MRFVSIWLVVLAVFFIGCAPQSVKKSGDMAKQAIVVANTSAKSVADRLANVEEGADTRDLSAVIHSDIVKPLDDAELLIQPVIETIGSPKNPVIYDKGSDAASILAAQALSQARLKNWIENKFKALAENILPGKLKALIPPPVEQKSDLMSMIQMAIAALIGSGGMYGGAKTIKKIATKKADGV